MELHNDGVDLSVRIVDDGVGVPEGFAIADTPSLGLSIVRTLVTSELHGTITMRRGTAGGAGAGPGTVVELVIPVGSHPEPITGSVPVVGL